MTLLVLSAALPGADELPEPPAAKPVLTQIRQVLDLSRSEAEAQYPVQVQGVTTCYDAKMGLFFVQDATAGIFVWNAVLPPQLRPGQRVAVTGISSGGRYSPVIVAASVRILGPAPLPSARKVSLGDVASGAEDAQWVEVQGIVHGVTEDWGQWVLDLASGGDHLSIRVLDHPAGAKPALTDARVSVLGVAGAMFDAHNGLLGFTLFVPDASELSVL
ncbi:MAG: hypothetical protein KGS61_02635, partial [Verrucomicrobia bacterium]|nr:hypothetical protein [Verrucomicrobiota bacterium]